MKNLLYNINKKGLTVLPVLSTTLEFSPTAGLSRAFYLSFAAIIVAAAGAVTGSVLTWVINVITALVFYGDVNSHITNAGSHELGMWVILLPVAGAGMLLLLSGYHSGFLRSLGITMAIGTGAPLGIESPAMIFSGALGIWIGKLLRCSATESHILFIAGACSAMATLFGSPVAAVFLALEVLLSEWTLCSILPVVMAAATAAAGSYLLRGTTPVYNMMEGPVINAQALVAYAIIGLIIGLLAAGSIKLSGLITKWFEKLIIYNQWLILLAALMVGMTGYVAPQVLGAGNSYINDLLHAHVTLFLLFALGILKLVAWLFFSGAHKTGSGITPLLIIGGATGLLIGVIIQLLFPSVIMHSGMIVLVGMGAMLAGSVRALLTTIIFAIEITHDVTVVLPLCLACMAAYGISLLLIKNKRKAADHLALD